MAFRAALEVKSNILKTEKIYTEWITSIDLTNTRIVNFPSYIFLCGGPISNQNNKYSSCRDIFYNYIKIKNLSFSNYVIRAEKIFDYFDESYYNDLLCFEKDLAELSSLTVLFSESPGSIAELGSFAVLPTIQERLLIVLHQDYADDRSFIWRGPVLFLKNLAISNKKENPITIYNWKNKKDVDEYFVLDDFSDAVDLAETIETILRKKPKTASFSKKKVSHVMLLIISFLKVAQLATLEEIVYILKNFKIDQELDKAKDNLLKIVKQYLSLLKSLKLIDLKRYRNYEYFHASSQTNWISWGYNTKTAKIRDADRWTSVFLNHYEKNEIEKYRALHSYLKKTGQIGN